MVVVVCTRSSMEDMREILKDIQNKYECSLLDHAGTGTGSHLTSHLRCTGMVDGWCILIVLPL